MTDTVTFKYTLSERDLTRVKRFLEFRSKFLWIILGLLTLYLGYRILGDIVLVMQGEKNWLRIPISFLVHGAFVVIPAASIWLSLMIHTRWAAKRSPLVGEEQEATFSDSGVIMCNSLSYGELAWAIFNKVIETDDFFLLYMNRGRGVCVPVPKRFLVDPRDIDRLRELIRENIPKASIFGV